MCCVNTEKNVDSAAIYLRQGGGAFSVLATGQLLCRRLVGVYGHSTDSDTFHAVICHWKVAFDVTPVNCVPGRGSYVPFNAFVKIWTNCPQNLHFILTPTCPWPASAVYHRDTHTVTNSTDQSDSFAKWKCRHATTCTWIFKFWKKAFLLLWIYETCSECSI